MLTNFNNPHGQCRARHSNPSQMKIIKVASTSILICVSLFSSSIFCADNAMINLNGNQLQVSAATRQLGREFHEHLLQLDNGFGALEESRRASITGFMCEMARGLNFFLPTPFLPDGPQNYSLLVEPRTPNFALISFKI